MYEAFRAGAGLTGSGDCLGWRQSPTSPYQWLSYNEVIARAQNFGSGLLSMGLRPGEHTMVGTPRGSAQNRIYSTLLFRLASTAGTAPSG